LHEGKLYVANQDALVRFEYQEGQTEASGPPTKVTDLPAEINHHWTKSLTISPDGRFLYVGIGSNSNITERGMEAEVDRAMIWQIDAETGAHKPYATGVRNPTALAIQPGTGQLWAVANERDELGPDLVPDYLTSIQQGGFYGWPYSYWGQNVDDRVPRRTRTRSRLPSSRTTRSARTSPLSGWPSPARPWETSSPMASSSANMAVGTGNNRWAIRLFSCRLATVVRPANRWIS